MNDMKELIKQLKMNLIAKLEIIRGNLNFKQNILQTNIFIFSLNVTAFLAVTLRGKMNLTVGKDN